MDFWRTFCNIEMYKERARQKLGSEIPQYLGSLIIVFIIVYILLKHFNNLFMVSLLSKTHSAISDPDFSEGCRL